MSRLSRYRRRTIELASGLLEIERVEKVSALVALVAPRVLVATERTLALDESVGQESLVLLAVRLDRRSLLKEAVLVKLGKDVLSDFRLLVGRGPAKDVEANVEPFVDLGVQLVVLVAQLFRCALFFDSLGLGGSSVLVGAANEEGGKAASLAVSATRLSAMSAQAWLDRD